MKNLYDVISAASHRLDKIREGKLYIAFEREFELFSEATNLSRIWQHSGVNGSFVFVSAFRNSLPLFDPNYNPKSYIKNLAKSETEYKKKFGEENYKKSVEVNNLKQHTKLIKTIRKKGYGFSVLHGGFTEKTTQGPKDIEELSVIIPFGGKSIPKATAENKEELRGLNRQFIKWGKRLRTTYKQDSVLLKEIDSQEIYSWNGTSKTILGKTKLDKKGQNYSKIIRGSHAGRYFVYEAKGIENPTSIGKVREYSATGQIINEIDLMESFYDYSI